VALAAIAAAGLTACAQAGPVGGGPPAGAPSSARPSPALAAARSAIEGADAGTADLRMILTGATVFGAGVGTAEAAGAFDFPALKGSLTLRPAGRAPEAVVFAPAAVYVQVPAPVGLLPRGKSWIFADLSHPATVGRNFPQLVAQAEGVDPGLALAEVAWGMVAATPAARQRLGAEDAVRYELQVDLREALRHVTGPARLPFRVALQSQLGARTRASEPAERPAPQASVIRALAWVTDTGQLAALQLRPPGAGVGVVSLSLGGPGAAVRADPPAPSQVADVTAISPFGERENQNGGDSDGA
jgi:hypothetical protein